MFEILVAALLALAPGSLDQDTARVHVAAAQAAADAHGLDPELLLAMGYVESRYNPYSLSRRQCQDGLCKRTTGVWTAETAPPGAQPSWFCGALQVGGYVPWARCRQLMLDVTLNYAVGAAHVREWEGSVWCRRLQPPEKLQCALRGYGGGNRAAREGSNRYPAKVLRVRERIRALRVV